MEDYIKEAQEKFDGKFRSTDRLQLDLELIDRFTGKECTHRSRMHDFIAATLTEARKKWLEEEVEEMRGQQWISLGSILPDRLKRHNAFRDDQISRLEAELKALK